MSEWCHVALGEVVKSLGGLWGQQGPSDDTTPVLAIRGTDFAAARRCDLSKVPLRHVSAKTLAKRQLNKNCILIEASGGSRDQPVGRALLITAALACTVPEPISAASFCKILRVDPSRANPRFVCACLEHAYHSGDIERYQTQSTGLRNLRTRQLLEEFELRLPPLGEQRRIAAFLAGFEELIAINERRIELLEDLARTLYSEWFVRFRFPRAMQMELVDSEVGRIPAAWPVESLGSVCSFIGAGNTPRRSDPTNWENGTVDWFTTGQLRDGPLTTSTEVVASKPSLRLFDPPMILMAIYGSPTVGRLGWITHTCSCNQAALALRARNAPDAQEWLWHLLVSLRARFNAMAQGAAQQNISKEKVANTFVAVPPPEILSRFAERAGPLRALSHELHAENARLAATRDLLLPRLVTGRLDISDVDLGDLLPAETAA